MSLYYYNKLKKVIYKEYEKTLTLYPTINDIKKKNFTTNRIKYFLMLKNYYLTKPYSEKTFNELCYLWNDGNLRTKKELYYTIGDGVKEVKKINSIARIIFICVLLQCFNPFIFLITLVLGYWVSLIPIMVAPIIANIYKKFAYSHLKYPLDCEIDYLGLAVYEGAALLGARGASKGLISLSNDKI